MRTGWILTLVMWLLLMMTPPAMAEPTVSAGVQLPGTNCIGNCSGGLEIPLDNVKEEGEVEGVILAVRVTNDIAICADVGTGGAPEVTPCWVLDCPSVTTLLCDDEDESWIRFVDSGTEGPSFD